MAEKEELDELKDMVQKLAERIEAGEKNDTTKAKQPDIQRILAEKEKERKAEFYEKPDEKQQRTFFISNRAYEKIKTTSVNTGIPMSGIVELLIENNL